MYNKNQVINFKYMIRQIHQIGLSDRDERLDMLESFLEYCTELDALDPYHCIEIFALVLDIAAISWGHILLHTDPHLEVMEIKPHEIEDKQFIENLICLLPKMREPISSRRAFCLVYEFCLRKNMMHIICASTFVRFHKQNVCQFLFGVMDPPNDI